MEAARVIATLKDRLDFEHHVTEGLNDLAKELMTKEGYDMFDKEFVRGSELYLDIRAPHSDIGQMVERKFKSWWQIQDGSWFQGEVDSQGLLDGRVVHFNPEGTFFISNYSDGESNGPCLHINGKGDMIRGQTQNGKFAGTWLKKCREGQEVTCVVIDKLVPPPSRGCAQTPGTRDRLDNDFNDRADFSVTIGTKENE